MRFLTFRDEDGRFHLGALTGSHRVVDLSALWGGQDAGGGRVPRSVGDLVEMGEEGMRIVRALLNGPAEHHPTLAFQDLDIAAPIPRPRKNVFCVGRNYKEHIIEGNLARGRDPNDFPKAVEFFSKPPTTVIGHKAKIKRHAEVTEFLDYEVELGVIIGKPGINIPKESAWEHVFGYTIVNDVSARDLQVAHGQWMKGKSLDASCPMGPVVVHHSVLPDPHALEIELEVNGELRQQAHTGSMLFSIADIIAQLSAGTTLEAGDIIATGTPSGVGLGWTPPRKLAMGDVIKARISGLGELENEVGA